MLTLHAPAKINWFLHITGLRKDGFHNIESLIQKVTLYDVVSFRHAENLMLETDSNIPNKQNLVCKAADLLRKQYEVKSGALMSLNKVIPVGAGLGGGSSDAAATLLGLNKLWSLDIPKKDLYHLAGQLGSDVPFFLHNSLSYVSGRGERVAPCKSRNKTDILIVKPSFNISTEWAYGQFRESHGSRISSSETIDKDNQAPEIQASKSEHSELTKKAPKVNNIEHFIGRIEASEVGDLADVLSNDLESVAIKSFPVIAEIKQRLIEQGAVFALMSGSGSAVFGVFDSQKMAEKASESFDGFWTAVVQTLID